MAFEDYAKAWFARRRGLTGSTKAATESRMRTHAYPEIGSRKMHTFDSFVVERFITAMERSNVGAATQAQVFLRVKGILTPKRAGSTTADNAGSHIVTGYSKAPHARCILDE